MNDLVIVLGALPPPMGGAAKNTKIISDALNRKTHTLTLNTSIGSLAHQRSISYHFRKILRTIYCSFKIFNARKQLNKSLYTVPDAGLGIIYTFIYCTIAYFLDFNIYLHHRSFKYIDQKSIILSALSRLYFKKISNIYLSPGMKKQYRTLYTTSGNDIICDNSCFLTTTQISNNTNKHLTIGHLSNLCLDKGYYEVISLYNQLKSNLPNTRIILKIAGKPINSEIKSHLNSLLQQNKQDIIYYNELHGLDKEQFYNSIDFFIFPTKFKQEAQPNVIYEAMAHSCVCISWGRGCIPEMISPQSGLVVPPKDDFIEPACKFIIKLSGSPSILENFKKNSFSELQAIKALADDQYRILLNLIAFGPKT